MLGKNHVIFGAGCYVASLPLLEFDVFQAFLFLPLALIGSLAPDLDIGNSRIKRNFFIWLITIPLTLFGHRTWSHSLITLSVFVFLTFWLEGYYSMGMLAFSIGYASHILGDFMTPRGVPLLYPLKTKFRSPFTFRTGSFIEVFVAMSPLLIAVALFFRA